MRTPDELIAYWRNEADKCVYVDGQPREGYYKLRGCANELEAALLAAAPEDVRATAPDDVVLRVEVEREEDGQYFASWTAANEGGSGEYSATPIGALAHMLCTLLLVEEDRIHAGEGRKYSKVAAAAPAPETGPRSGIERIAAERQRQIEKEGWTPQHDDDHDDNEMLMAAYTYIQRAWAGPNVRMKIPPSSWPWGDAWWKPSNDPIRNLEKAGALIAAEIDRLDRLAASSRSREGET
jgi:hypothetical protein